MFECEIHVDTDYTKTHIIQTGKNTGKVAYDDMQSMPIGGSYKYATNPMTQANDLGAWYISYAIKINRALTQEECDTILREHGFSPQEWEGGSLDLSALNYDPTLTDSTKKILEPTYDDEGRLIPLSERCNMEKEIIFNIDVMLARRKMSSGELAEKVGITATNLSILKTGKAKAVRFSTLEALCRALECQPGDILEYSSEG